MRKERAMPQTVLLIHDDGAKARRVTDALFNSNDEFYNVAREIVPDESPGNCM
jgi:hypothetical protein